MALREIITEGDPILSKRCHPVEKFDAKLPLSRKDGKQIGSNKGNVGNFSKIMYQEAAEFRVHPENMVSHDSLVMGLSLYKIMKNLIAKTNPDEHVVFFIPSTGKMYFCRV